ncbi:extracellular solute-binding protein [Sinisalibacter aestuarii]|uniref:Sugar ABC transporter substrate-binding protein n=1 Tax=Sinisalibacter aestuarii TaxID=2949426 RepID=A0ABQ5LQW6_9RHOB|nr:extracellular solute-binding protein [Sinisalibacter aestuarii]GKY87404.1 sugar ABC transporter substrate-binding protein [Sinisalibacter aestuarii]
MSIHFKQRALVAACVASFAASPALAQTEINVVGFGAGFAWADLFGATGAEKTQKLLDFEKEHDIVVNMEFADEDVARQKVLLDLVNGTGDYDLVMLGSDGAVQTFSAAGYLEALGPYLETAPDLFDPAKVYPPFLEANTVAGELYALPYYSFGAGAVYRKDLFDKYGISEFPKTTEEMATALQTLKDGFAADGITDVYPLTMRGAPGEEPSLDLNGFVYAYAGYPAWFEGGPTTPEEIKASKAQPIFTGDFKEGFSTFVNWSREYGPPGIAGHTWVDMMNLYAQGKAAILFPSAINAFAGIPSSEVPEVKEFSAFAPSPAGPSGKVVQSFWTFSVGVSAFSKNKQEAYEVLAFLTSEDVMRDFAEVIGWPYTTYPSIMHSPTLTDKWPTEMLDQIEASFYDADPHYFPYIPELTEFMDHIGTAASSAISGAQTIDEALDELQSWATERMDRAGYYK